MSEEIYVIVSNSDRTVGVIQEDWRKIAIKYTLKKGGLGKFAGWPIETL